VTLAWRLATEPFSGRFELVPATGDWRLEADGGAWWREGREAVRGIRLQPDYAERNLSGVARFESER
jgi:hypothetical protein